MTRRELIRMLVLRARAHGFEFRKWYEANIETEWQDLPHAVAVLESGKRYYALLFSHDFARNFWKKGTQITFILPSQEYTRLDKNGKIVTIQRKAFTRRTSRSTSNTVWQYHLEQMAVWEEPLRYIRRFILTDEELESSGTETPAPAAPKKPRGLARRPINWL
ncbi:MAG TPA: hypothetical protein VHX60_14735 [Acidobacteriaceae bacterium]|jgi:hypothetical protein|nr:hypothetical protein [Acidobacteriaceae bacterium]